MPPNDRGGETIAFDDVSADQLVCPHLAKSIRTDWELRALRLSSMLFAGSGVKVLTMQQHRMRI